jgi:predicted amidohydrolase
LGIEDSVNKNLDKGLQFMEQASRDGACLVCFPECQFGPYFPQFPNQDASAYALPLDYDVIRTFQGACRELGVAVVLSLSLDEKGRRYDASPIFDSDGTLLDVSKKVHIVRIPFWFE